MKATVAICTFNGARRVPAVLEALLKQTAEPSWWEILVVDNASTDGTSAVAEELLRKRCSCSWRVVREPVPGLSHARRRSGLEASGPIVCFLDDDNLPSPAFVSAAVRAFGQRPRAGVVGGKVVPVWESAPTPLALAVQDFALAICNRGEVAFRYGSNMGPVGAGLCIRREVLRAVYADKRNAAAVTGRTTNGLGGGEDLAIAVLAWRLGWECWYDPTLVVEHLLPATRMGKDYLLRLYEGIGRGQAAVRRLYDWKARTPLEWVIGSKDFCRWLSGRFRECVPDLESPSLASDLHDLEQRQVLGRALQAMHWPPLH